MRPSQMSPTLENPSPNSAIAPSKPFAKPSPGTWKLDASHCERPLPQIIEGIMKRGFESGFRKALENYGAPLDVIEVAEVNGFIYQCERPIGAPPEPNGLPPKALFKLMTLLHPRIRKRLRRAEKIWEEKPWREETRRYLEELSPALEREVTRLLRIPLAGLSDSELADHIGACRKLLEDDLHLHFTINMSRVVPVGDFLIHAQGWTGAAPAEILELMRGSSPGSHKGMAELESLAVAIGADASLREKVLGPSDAETLLGELEARNDGVGEATRNWVTAVGHRVTGFEPGFPTFRETPATLLECLRGKIRESDSPIKKEESRRVLENLRARVPAEHRSEFDGLLEEARLVYFLRDHACQNATECCGLVRLAALEAGKRLTRLGLAPEPEAGLYADYSELRSLLLEGKGPSSAELADRLVWRRAATVDIAPEVLGPPPVDPPPPEWLPPGSARLARAAEIYVKAMLDSRAEKNQDKSIIHGLAASGGKRIGIARLVLHAGDFDKIGPGDILVARLTSPSYNLLLPLLAGIVTDRGGILSHPAIVSREFGIPGVVGTRNATSLIPDGASVEIDGDAGTVRVLS